MSLRLRSRAGTVLAGLAGLVVVVAVSTLVLYSHSADQLAAAQVERRVSVDGHGLFLSCRGAGSPTVILDAGLGESHRAWDRVLNGADLKTRVCAYDRWGVGDSEPATTGTRSIGDATADLHALLAAAEIGPPYVLVGHSVAGLIGRHYTKLYPAEVKGLVMLDTAPDDWDQYNHKSVFTSGGESLDIAEVAASLRASDNLTDRPVVVVQAARTTEISGAPQFAEYWQAAQRNLAALSSNSLFVVAANSNHGIASSQPELVAGAVALVLNAVQTRAALPACASSSLPALGGSC